MSEEITRNPAALVALARGDIENAAVAATPGGIEAQEKAGQALLVASELVPKKLHPSRDDFIRAGFVFGKDADDLFVNASLPAGWTREPSDHSMWSYITDEQGRRRVEIFYKAAFYDRRAEAYLLPA